MGRDQLAFGPVRQLCGITTGDSTSPVWPVKAIKPSFLLQKITLLQNCFRTISYEDLVHRDTFERDTSTHRTQR